MTEYQPVFRINILQKTTRERGTPCQPLNRSSIGDTGQYKRPNRRVICLTPRSLHVTTLRSRSAEIDILRSNGPWPLRVIHSWCMSCHATARREAKMSTMNSTHLTVLTANADHFLEATTGTTFFSRPESRGITRVRDKKERDDGDAHQDQTSALLLFEYEKWRPLNQIDCKYRHLPTISIRTHLSTPTHRQPPCFTSPSFSSLPPLFAFAGDSCYSFVINNHTPNDVDIVPTGASCATWSRPAIARIIPSGASTQYDFYRSSQFMEREVMSTLTMISIDRPVTVRLLRPLSVSNLVPTTDLPSFKWEPRETCSS